MVIIFGGFLAQPGFIVGRVSTARAAADGRVVGLEKVRRWMVLTEMKRSG